MTPHVLEREGERFRCRRCGMARHEKWLGYCDQGNGPPAIQQSAECVHLGEPTAEQIKVASGGCTAEMMTTVFECSIWGHCTLHAKSTDEDLPACPCPRFEVG